MHAVPNKLGWAAEPSAQHWASLVLMMQLDSVLDSLTPLLAPGSKGGYTASVCCMGTSPTLVTVSTQASQSQS